MKGKALKKAIVVAAVTALLVSTVSSVPTQAAKKVKLNKTKVTIKVGRSVKLKLKNAKKKVTWKSSNKKVAVVNKKGKVTGKKQGTVKITAKSAGKKYTCTVSVKGKTNGTTPSATAEGTTNPISTQKPGTTQLPSGTTSANPSQSPSVTKKPLGTSTITPSETTDPNQTPGVSATPNTEETQNPSSTSSPEVNQTPNPSAATNPTPTPNPSAATNPTPTPSSSEDPEDPEEPEEPAGEISQVELGMAVSELRTLLGTELRVDSTPQGYEGYVFKPSGTFEDYILVYIDNEKVVGLATMSGYYSYGDIVAIGDAQSSLSGFSNMNSKYAYEGGYLYETADEYIMAYSDHQSDSKVYAVQIFATTDGEGNAVELDSLITAEELTYTEEILEDMAYQMTEWVNAFRYTKGIPLAKYYNGTGAQQHSDDMASTGTLQLESSNGTTMEARFDANYKDYLGLSAKENLGKCECNAGRSPDAFGVVAWCIDDTDSGSTYRDYICNDTSTDFGPYYVCAGFSYNASKELLTFATLDFFY